MMDEIKCEEGHFNRIVDQGKNYLEVPADGDSYVIRMIVENEVPGLVKASFKSHDGEDVLEYLLSDMSSLDSEDGVKSFNADRMRNFLESFLNVCRGMEEYMLPFNGLVVRPDSVFEKAGDEGGFYFVYDTDATFMQKKNEQGFGSLFEYILDNVERGDEEAVRMAYLLYQAVRDARRSGNGREVTEIIREKAVVLLQTPLDGKSALKQDAKEFMEEEKRMIPKKALQRKEYTAETELAEEGSTYGSKKEEKESIFGKIWSYLNEDVKFGKKRDDSDGEDDENEEYEEDAEEECMNPFVKTEDGREGVLILDPVESCDEKVMITHFPFFVGKGDKGLDHTVEDASVSRCHARIDKRADGTFSLTDLDSTNGSFVNGIRLIPFKKATICTGDSIVLSRREYIFSMLA